MAKMKRSTVSLVQGVNIPAQSDENMANLTTEVNEQAATDTANEQAEAFEKAVLAALPHAEKYVKTHADFHLWLEASTEPEALRSNAKAARETAFDRAKLDALKIANEGMLSTKDKLLKQLAEIEAQEKHNQLLFGLTVQPAKPASGTGKRGRPAKGTSASGSTPFNESDIIHILNANPDGLTGKAIAKALSEKLKSAIETKTVAPTLKKLREDKKIGTDNGNKAAMKYLLA